MKVFNIWKDCKGGIVAIEVNDNSHNLENLTKEGVVNATSKRTAIKAYNALK